MSKKPIPPLTCPHIDRVSDLDSAVNKAMDVLYDTPRLELNNEAYDAFIAIIDRERVPDDDRIERLLSRKPLWEAT